MSVRIQQDLSLVEVMDKLLEEYVHTSYDNYKKQLRVQIKNTALQDEAFRNEMDYEIHDEFSSAPRLDEIEDLLNEMPPTLADILDRHGIRETAKKFSKKR